MTAEPAAPAVVEIPFDFGGPNAYLAHRVIPAIERLGRVRFDYQPILLGGLFKATGTRSPMVAFAEIPAKLAYERLGKDRLRDVEEAAWP